MKPLAVLAISAAIMLSMSGCDGSYTKSDIEQALNEGYAAGYEAGYEEAEASHYSEDEMNKAFADGYDAGWNDCESGNEYGDGIIAFVK